MNQDSPTRMFSTLLIGVALATGLSSLQAAYGKDLETAKPESVGMNPAKLADLKAAMSGYIEKGQRAGIVYAVARKGKIVAFETLGKRDIARDLPMERDTAFRIYSQSRAVTAAATLTLLDEGKISLNDPVAKYIPEVGKMQVISRVEGDRIVTEPQKTPMSVFHLFTYTSGLGYANDWPKNLGIKQTNILDINGSIEQSVQRIAQLPLLTQPGAKWRYGFSGDVLGRVAEVASGQPLNEFLKARLFDQLKMPNTGFWVSEQQMQRHDLASAYTIDAQGKLSDISGTILPLSTYTKPGPLFSAGGGLVSTVPDYMRFAQMLLNGGTLDGVRVLKPETVKAMLQRQTTPEQGEVYWYAPDNFPTVKGFAWGLSIGVRPDDAGPNVPGRPGEAGWAGVANTLFFINTKEQVVAALMAQYQGPNAGALNFAFRDGVYAAMTP